MQTETLRSLLNQIERHPATASPALQRYLDDSVARSFSDPRAFLDMLFLNAIRERALPESGRRDHLYLAKFDIPQIQLFDLLINKFPLVSMGHRIANETIAGEMAASRNAVLVDIGIGHGIQVAKLIDRLASQRTAPETLTVIGVELNREALERAGQTIARVGATSGIEVSFVPVLCSAEELTAETLRAALPEAFDRLIVNASLALHHLPSVTHRVELFKLLRGLEPDAVVLTEPDSDHLEPEWARRVENAYIHYGAVFEVIDRLDVTDEEKRGLKAFFGREIVDVVSLSEGERVERHEPAANWVRHLAAAGFTSRSIPESLVAAPGIDCRENDMSYLSMRHRTVDVLSVMHFG